MENVEKKLSVGTCLIKPVSSSEFRELSLLCEWAGKDFDEKINNARSKREKSLLRRQKAKAITREYFNVVSDFILKHNFNLNGKPLGDFMGELSEDDVSLFEDGLKNSSSVSVDEAEDFQEPSETIDTSLNTGVSGTFSLNQDYAGVSGSDGVK